MEASVGLFALSAAGNFFGVAPIATSPFDARGFVKRPGRGHADAYSLLEPFPWNDTADAAFGNGHYARHSHVRIGRDGQNGVVVVASVATTPSASPVPDPYFGWVTRALPPRVEAFTKAWLGTDPSFMDKADRLHASKGLYEIHGLLFFKVPTTLAFSRNVNLSLGDIEEWKKRFEQLK